jgi:hypothetical protein
MKPRMAQTLQIYLCEHCAAVHIGMFRNGKLFAEAIPNDPDSVLRDLQEAIAESRARQGASDTTGRLN